MDRPIFSTVDLSDQEKICFIPNIYDNLLNSPDIDSGIIEAYYKDMHPNEAAPFIPNFIFGAFIRKEEYGKIKYYINGKIGISKNTISGWKEYAEGFQKGFDDFQEEFVINPGLPTKYNIMQKIIQKHHDRQTGNLFQIENIGKRNERIKWREMGFELGKLYSLWFVILRNHILLDNIRPLPITEISTTSVIDKKSIKKKYQIKKT